MKINKLEYYKEFILKYIKKEQNIIISANKIYTLFCSVYDLNPNNFPIKSFTPNFTKAYAILYNEKLEKTSRRLTIGENPKTCFVNIDLTTRITGLEQPITPVLTLNERDTNTKIAKTNLKNANKRVIPSLLQQPLNVIPTGMSVDLSLFLDYFIPGDESDPIILTKDFYELYNNLYLKSPEHKKLIPHLKRFKIIFKKYWDARYPNNNLKESRKNNDRGFKFIKRIK